MTIKSFRTKFKRFGNLENPVNFGYPDDPDKAHLILAKPPEIKIKERRVELYGGNAESVCVTAKQLFDHVKSFEECYDEFELFFMRFGGGGWSVERVSQYPQNGVVYLDCNPEMSG
jgi:hypothetical protein